MCSSNYVKTALQSTIDSIDSIGDASKDNFTHPILQGAIITVKCLADYRLDISPYTTGSTETEFQIECTGVDVVSGADQKTCVSGCYADPQAGANMTVEVIDESTSTEIAGPPFPVGAIAK